MRVEKDLFGDDVVIYDSREEEMAAIRNYLDGDWSKLTRLQVKEFRECERDPYGVRWEAEHAGRFAEEVDELDFNGLVFIYDVGRTFEEGRQILLDMVGPHPITSFTIWELRKKLEAACAAVSSKPPYRVTACEQPSEARQPKAARPPYRVTATAAVSSKPPYHCTPNN